MRIAGTMVSTSPELLNALIHSGDHAGFLPARDAMRLRLRGGRIRARQH